MFCRKCGYELPEGSIFCPKCGVKAYIPSVSAEIKHEPPKPEPKLEQPRLVRVDPVPRENPAPEEQSGGTKYLFMFGFVILVAVIISIVIAFTSKKEVPILTFPDDTEAITVASDSVVRLFCLDEDGKRCGEGNGFAISKDGIIVTNYHLIEHNVARVIARTQKQVSECSTIVAFDAEKDIAILKTDRDMKLPLLQPGDPSVLQEGERVLVLERTPKVESAPIPGEFIGYNEKSGRKLLQHTASDFPDSCGGALFNDSGEVIGISFSSDEAGKPLSYAIPITEAQELYENTKNAKGISMEEYYDKYGRVSPIPTYTVGYLLEHFEELDGQDMYLEGYASTIYMREITGKKDLNATVLYLVDQEELIKGRSVKSTTEYDFSREAKTLSEENNDVFLFSSVRIYFDDTILDWIQPGDKVSVLCHFYVNEGSGDITFNEGHKLFFTGYDISVEK